MAELGQREAVHVHCHLQVVRSGQAGELVHRQLAGKQERRQEVVLYAGLGAVFPIKHNLVKGQFVLLERIVLIINV